MQSFTIIGTIKAPKETANFKPYEDKTFDSGWNQVTQKLSVRSGSNSIFLEANGGKRNDDSGFVYSFTKTTYVNGKKVPGESVKIPFKERLTSPLLSKIAEFKLFTVDFGNAGKRKVLRDLLDQANKGNDISSEQLAEVGLTDKSQLAEAYKIERSKKHSYVSSYDFTQYLHKIIANPKLEGKKFKITGEVEHTYGSAKNTFYEKKVIHSITLMPDDAEEFASTSIDFHFDGEENVVTENEEGTKATVSGYVPFYTSLKDIDFKGTMYAPIDVTFNKGHTDLDERKYKLLKNIFESAGNNVMKIGLNCDIVDGAEAVHLTLEDLPEEVQDMVAMGMMREADAIRDYQAGRNISGDRVREYRIATLKNVKPEETELSHEDMTNEEILAPAEGEHDVVVGDDVAASLTESAPASGLDDLFDDSDDFDLDSDDLPF